MKQNENYAKDYFIHYYQQKEEPQDETNDKLQTLEQAAGDYIVQLNGEDLEGGFNAAFNAFKAGAEWQKKQDELTWEDMRNIYILIDRIDRKKYPPITVGFYEEILRQFNEIKGSTTITEIETVVQNR